MDNGAPFEIEISDTTSADDPDPYQSSRIRDAVRLTLRRHACPRCSISIALVDDARIAELHDRYMGCGDPTDVITFNLSERDSPILEGEIVISKDTAARESNRRGHPCADELTLYAVHGTLHLLGYADAKPDDAARMHAMEDEILVACGIGPVYGVVAE